MRFLNSKHASDTSSSDKDFSEEASAFLVFKSVDGEDLLAVYICQAKDCLDLVETFTELALVKQHHHIRVVDDGFLHDRTSHDVLNLLSNHTHRCPELTGCLVEVLDIFCHHWRSYGFPCLLDDKHLAVFLDTHLLNENVHDDKCNKREEERVILDGVNLKDDEGLIKQLCVEVLIECKLMTTALIEVLQQIVVGCQVYSCQIVLLYNLRNTDFTVLVECVERQVLYLFLHEVFIEVFRDNLLYETVFRLGDFTLGSFPDEHDQIFQEAYLLDVQLLTLDGKRIHRDRMLVCVADILATNIFAESFI